MKLRALTVVCLLFTIGPALAQKVSVEYDPKYPGETIETFAWDASAGKVIKETSELLHDHIVATIEKYLDADGFRKVDGDPDVYVTYHAGVDQTVKLKTVDFGYVIPTGWYTGPLGGSVSTYTGGMTTGTDARTWEKGTFVVDVFAAESKRMVWRGVASDITVSWNPKKIEKRLDKAVAKMVDQWKRIRAGKPEQD